MSHLRLIEPAPAPTLDAMRTPLTCIAGFAELLAAPGADLGPAEAQWAQAMADSAAELLTAFERYADASDGS